MAASLVNLELAEEISQFYHDPYGFVLFAYPWGEKGGPLEAYDGPDAWQTQFLKDLGVLVTRRAFGGVMPVAPVRMAVSSGHGTGKTTLWAWVVDWIMSTRPNARGTVTANTFSQLQTKTWAAVQHWTRLCITAHWFKVTNDRMFFLGHADTWCCSITSCAEENSRREAEKIFPVSV